MQTLSFVNEQISKLGVCVIIPTYNNCNTLKLVIEGVLAFTNNIIIVNDGSTDATQQILNEFPLLYHLSNLKNSGKGVALSKGLKFAIDKGFNYAITIDSDGQHSPNDIPVFIKSLHENGESLIIGNRFMEKGKVPGKSYFGRDFSNFWFWIETGLKNPDTQSGFRLYPLNPLKNIKLFTRKFEFEIEIIVRLAWKSILVSSVPIGVVYFSKELRVSHFRPFKDFTRISILNTLLVTLAIIYYRPLLYIRNKKISHLFFNPNETIHRKASSIAFGVFMGIIPIWGFQLISAIALAFVFRLNKPLVVVFANISLPPMIPVIIYLSMLCGSIWFQNSISLLPNSYTFESIKPFMLQYIYGSVFLAFTLAALAWVVSFLILKLFKNKFKHD